jgi:preprotein translocase subunit SecD
MHRHDLKPNSAEVRRSESGLLEVIVYPTDEGRHKLLDSIKQHSGKFMAILLDSVVYSTSRVNAETSLRGVSVAGNFTMEEADHLVKILNTDSFPAPVRIVEERIVNPTFP